MSVANTWIASSAGLASVGSNWSLGHTPTTGEIATFNSTSANNCSYDSIQACDGYNFSGYAGNVTQGANDLNFTSSGNITIAGGTLTGHYPNKINLPGNLTWISGSIADDTASFVMSGTNNTISLCGFTDLRLLEISGNITLTGFSPGLDLLQVDSSGILNIANTFTAFINTWSNAVPYINNGHITGAGTLDFEVLNADFSLTLGNVSSNVKFNLVAAASAGHKFTLKNTEAVGPILVASANATYSMTLDLAGYYLTAPTVNYATRGIILSSSPGATLSTGSLINGGGTYNGTNITLITVPVASFTVAPSSGSAGKTSFAFQDTSFGTPSSWQWVFGDGRGSSNIQNPSYVFPFSGNYTVTLQVSNGWGSSTTSPGTSIAISVGVGLRVLLGSLIQAQYGIGQANIYWTDQRRECQAGIPLIKVYPMPGGDAKEKGLGYGYRELAYRFTIDIKCLNETNAYNAMTEVIRILGANRLSPFSGYDKIEFSEGNFHAGGAGFYWWTVEATVRVYRKPVAT